MHIRSRELDTRNSLYGIMRYQIICSLPLFFEVRNWCWAQYGPGIEYEHYHNYHKLTKIRMPWAWDCAKYQGSSISQAKIYLPDNDDMYSLFALTWIGHG